MGNSKSWVAIKISISSGSFLPVCCWKASSSLSLSGGHPSLPELYISLLLISYLVTAGRLIVLSTNLHLNAALCNLFTSSVSCKIEARSYFILLHTKTLYIVLVLLHGLHCTKFSHITKVRSLSTIWNKAKASLSVQHHRRLLLFLSQKSFK